MTEYRLYLLDGQGKIRAAEPLEADGDASAVARALALGRDAVCELWERDRFVATIPRHGSAPSGRAPRPR